MNNQLQYIEYIKELAERNKIHIWLGGSFLRGNATAFSDVDISVYCDVANLSEIIYAYGSPVYISYTSNPAGILIIIYEDGVAVDLEIVAYLNSEEYIDEENYKDQFAHLLGRYNDQYKLDEKYYSLLLNGLKK
ncbi:MAG: nucleotidyltransferase domain-containing protein [Eubacterium sp.]|nr:nucleotidyltransferase domain-containing protein [Eubacterium sp.]